MAYYRGDYYRGDYYRGDFLGIGKAVKKIGSLIGGAVRVGTSLVTGGPLAAAGTALSLIKPKNAALQPMIGPTSPSFTGIRVGGPLGVQVGYQGSSSISNYPVTQTNGGGGGRYTVAPDGTLRKKHRRMNPTNVRALRRAGRRVRGFLKLARRLGALPVSPRGKRLFRVTHRRKK